MTQWDAFNMLVSNGVKRFFNPTVTSVKTKELLNKYNNVQSIQN